MSNTSTDGVNPESTSRTRGRESILRVDGLQKSFGGIDAVDGATFEVEEGIITGLIGPNGAGKSTLFNLVTGFLTPNGGSVYFDSSDITGFKPYQTVDQGLVRTFQLAHDLSEMSVRDNLMLAPQQQLGENFLRSTLPGFRTAVEEQEESIQERTGKMLNLFDIEHLADEYAGNLSGGQRKLLALARAMMTEPEMLMLDEPFAGVNPTLQNRLLKHLHEFQQQGYTVLLVEHDMDVIMNNCEHVVVLHQGQVLAEGEPATIRADERVVEAYLGGDV